MNNTFTDEKVNTSFCPEDNACIIPSINPEDNTCISPKGIIYNCSIDPKGNITGFTEDHVKALYNPVKNTWFYGQDIGRNNLVSLKDRTVEERKEIVRKAHKAREENKEREKSMNDLAKALLRQEAPEEEIEEVLGNNRSSLLDNSYASLILAAMVKGAKEGSFKCAEFIRDTAGYKPKNEVELQADIMTEADKSLIDKALKTG